MADDDLLKSHRISPESWPANEINPLVIDYIRTTTFVIRHMNQDGVKVNASELKIFVNRMLKPAALHGGRCRQRVHASSDG